MQTRFYTNKENLIKFLKWVKENIKDAVIIDSKLKGDDVIDLIEKDILTHCGVLVFDKDCEIFKEDINDKENLQKIEKILKLYPGRDEVFLCTTVPKKKYKWNGNVTISNVLIENLKQILNETCIKIVSQ